MRRRYSRGKRSKTTNDTNHTNAGGEEKPQKGTSNRKEWPRKTRKDAKKAGSWATDETQICTDERQRRWFSRFCAARGKTQKSRKRQESEPRIHKGGEGSSANLTT